LTEKTADMEKGRIEGAKQDLVEVTCPHCGETFGVDRKAIA
jgi:hypothetical protein